MAICLELQWVRYISIMWSLYSGSTFFSVEFMPEDRVAFAAIVMDLELDDGRLIWIIDNDQLTNFFPLPREYWFIGRRGGKRFLQAAVPRTRLQPLQTVYALESTLCMALAYSRTSCSTKWLRLCSRILRMMNSCLLTSVDPRSLTPYMMTCFFNRTGIEMNVPWNVHM